MLEWILPAVNGEVHYQGHEARSHPSKLFTSHRDSARYASPLLQTHH